MTTEIDRSTIFAAGALEHFRAARRIEPRCMRRFRHMYLQRHRSFEESANELPERDRQAFLHRFQPHQPIVAAQSDSQLNGASKLALSTERGDVVESVLLRTPGTRTTLCVSSQVGCAARCEFCATGYLSPVKNLSTVDILNQADVARRIAHREGLRIRNLVFMGMGEPFHNESAVCDAMRLLQDPGWFAFGPRRTMVSTVGVPDAMVRWAVEFPKSPLALSLHSADQELREKLIPAAKRTSLVELREAMDEVVRLQDNAPIMIEYLMLRDVNDSLAQAAQLADYLDGLPALVNLIPYNPIAEAPHFQSTDRDGRERFGAALQERGFLVKIRFSLGADIDAACGQLAARTRE